MFNCILFIFFSFIINSCCGPGGIDGSGRITSEARDMATFHSITLKSSANIFITQSENQKVRIEAEDNILPLIKTYVDSKTLVITTKDWICRHEPINIYIQMKDVKSLNLSGSGKIIGESKIYTENIEIEITGSGKIDLSIDADEVFSEISGSGKISLTGEAGDHNVRITGSGNIKASDLKANNCKIKVTGSGNCNVHAKNELDVRISGSGNVTYYGNPAHVNSNISGSGKLRKVDR